MGNEHIHKTIDLEKVLASKGIKAPAFVVKLLGRLLHVDELNAGIYANRDAYGVEFAQRLMSYLNFRTEVEGLDNLPQEGSPIVVSNHPLGGPDGIALIAVVGERRPDIHVPVNDFLMHLPNLEPIFIPVDKVHRNGRALGALSAAFASKDALLYFPSGKCSRRHNGVIRDPEWKPTVVQQAIRYGRPLVPVYFEARLRNRFYLLANLRERLHVKFNLEMALLPAEMFAQKGNTFRIVIGRPLDVSLFDKRHTPYQWAQRLQQHVYNLASNPQASFENLLS